MVISYDPGKNIQNMLRRRLSFERAADFEFDDAVIWEDTRKPYPETRFVALGYLDDRLHVLCFSNTADGIRVISFRKANKREGARYGFALTRH